MNQVMREVMMKNAVLGGRKWILFAAALVIIVVAALLMGAGDHGANEGSPRNGGNPSSAARQPRITGDPHGRSAQKGVQETDSEKDKPEKPTFVAFGDNARITTDCIQALELKDEEIEKLQKLIADLQAEVAMDFVERTVLTGSFSNGSSYRYTYFTKGGGDVGKALLEAFDANVDQTIGEDRGRTFMESMKGSELMAQTGKWDIETEITRNEGDVLITQSYLSSKSGKVTRKIVETPEAFKRRFSDLFLIPDK